MELREYLLVRDIIEAKVLELRNKLFSRALG
jgi:hypothetical protein